MMPRIPERFWHPYYVLNILLGASYVILRIKCLDPGELSAVDPFGFTREFQIYFSLTLMLFVRILSAATLDAYMGSCFMFVRTSVLVCLWFMERRLCGLFALLWTVIFIAYPQPRYKHPPSVMVLNNVSFDQRIQNNMSKTINVVWFHATWSPRCTQFAPILAELTSKYKHVRMRFCKLDLSRWPGMADRYNISMAPSSVQLPTVICFRQGVESDRIPSLQDVESCPSKWRRGFTAAHVAHALKLDSRMAEAQKWETDAKHRYLAGQQAQKDK